MLNGRVGLFSHTVQGHRGIDGEAGWREEGLGRGAGPAEEVPLRQEKNLVERGPPSWSSSLVSTLI
jgi:hypothetical protein